MFKNYFKIAWRNLLRDRQFSFLNLLGLSTGLACAILIWLWINNELNMDKYNEKDEQLYQVMQNLKENNGIQTMEYTSGLLANALASEMPEVEWAATVVPASCYFFWRYPFKPVANYQNYSPFQGNKNSISRPSLQI